MKIKNLIIFICLFFILIPKLFAEEVEFEASNMEIKDNGNIVFAYNSNTSIPNKNIYIKSKNVKYDKKKNIIIFTGKVLFNDTEKDIIIEGDKIIYERSNNLIYSKGSTNFNIKKEYIIKSSDVYYNREKQIIYSDQKTEVYDSDKNIYKLPDKFIFEIRNEIIKSTSSEIIDKDKNVYLFEDLAINLKNKEIAGKEIKINFKKSYFGNDKNDPILKGRSAYSNNDELKLYNAVFSTCNIDKKKCRGWELNSEEFRHDKKKKIFEYKNSWLKLFDYKVFYLPYFNHPDPTIKRKSGFLTPSYASSESLGTSIDIPYFQIIDIDKDITFNPRYYSDNSFLLQNEYRQALQNSKILSDFSFLVGNAGTKGHFFYNQVGNINDKTTYSFNLQDVEGDNYLKNHNLRKNSKLIKDENVLLSNLDINWSFDKSKLNSSFKVYEDLTRNYHDRYQYIFPDFNFSRSIKIPKDYNGYFDFYSYGYNKNYDTNRTEAVITNDFLFKSNEFINSNGISTNYNLLLKNSNSYSDNSQNFEENGNYDLFGTIKLSSALPLRQIKNDNINYLTPKVSFRYSPNGNTDLSAKDIILNYDSAFDLNRIGTNYQVEGGESLSLGLEYKKTDYLGNNILDFRFANVLKPTENIKLPRKSKLNKTRSDIFGDFNYNINNDLKIGYSFSYDKDLEYSNLEQVNLEYGVNNFITNFSYYTEDNDIGNKESIKNNTSYQINDNSKFNFEVTKDLKQDFTEYYDLIYTYQTDCISLNLNYNKSFYRDGNLEPNKSLSFLIKIIPFTEIGVPNVGSLIGK
tara:strand:- start:3591 stop:5984 length:2394 start_codon:yes stop_codon:yes gene_type:complete